MESEIVQPSIFVYDNLEKRVIDPLLQFFVGDGDFARLDGIQGLYGFIRQVCRVMITPKSSRTDREENGLDCLASRYSRTTF